jgi:hypothetical protein
LTVEEFDDLCTSASDRDLARALRDHFNIELWCVLIAAFKVEASRCGLLLGSPREATSLARPERWLLDRLGAAMLETRRRHIMPFADPERIRVTAAEISDGYAFRWAETMIRSLAENDLELIVSSAAEYDSACALRERYMTQHLKPERGVFSVRASSPAEAYALAVEHRRRKQSESAVGGQGSVATGTANDGL